MGPAARTSATPDRVEPVAAATVVLLRDRPTTSRSATSDDTTLEVLMLERHLDSDFAGGALVFPGGKVDPGDRRLDAARWIGPSLPRWRGWLGTATDAEALGSLTAAVRECFEEAGVLLACREDGTELTADDLASPSFLRARERLGQRGRTWDWRSWLSDEGLTLDFGTLAPWSWWVTPAGQHRRFDTRFFLALLPPAQVARHDGVETTSLRWTSPQQALDDHERGTATVIFPTRHNLRDLLDHRTAAAAWRSASDRSEPLRRIEPRIVHLDDRTLVQHPDGGPPEPI